MSIMIMNKESVEKIVNSNLTIKKLIGCNWINYNHFETIVKKLYSMNIDSWNERYPSEALNEDDVNTFYTIDSNSKEKFNNKCELLKTLQCLSYNIELKKYTDREKRHIDCLNMWIEGLKNDIINNLDDYKIANWG